MKNKNNKSILLGLGSICGLSLLVGNVFATFIVTAAPTIGVRIGIAGLPKHKVTYYLPTSESSSTFTSHELEVEEGTNLYSALDSYTTNVGAYSFGTWHLDKDSSSLRTDGDNYAKNLVASDYKVSGDITVYAKYTQSNVGYYYDTANRYITSNQSNITIDSSSFYYGTRIYSLDGVEGSEVDLISSSGKYTLTKNSNNWTVLRHITVNLSNVSSWWTSSNAKHGIYCANDDSSSSEWVSPSYANNKYTFAVNVAYTKFVVVRYKDTSPVNTGWDNIWNQTVDITLSGTGSGSNVYGSANNSGGVKCYEMWVGSDTVGTKQNYSWWHS